MRIYGTSTIINKNHMMYFYIVSQAWCNNIALEHMNNPPYMLNNKSYASGLVINKSKYS